MKLRGISRERINGNTQIAERITLSPIDHFEVFFFIEVVYFFSETVDADALKSSLARTLDVFPVVCGQLERNQTGSLSIEKTTDGVSFTVWESDRPLPAPVDTHLTEYDALVYIERPNPFTLTKKNAPLATFKLTHMHGGGSALGICMAHVLTDGHGFFSFLNCWSRIHNGQPHSTPFFDRSLVELTDEPINDASVRNKTNPSEQCNGFRYRGSVELITFLMKVLFNKHRMVTSTLHFSESQLNAIKEQGSEDGRISLNDAISSHLWKCYSKLFGLKGDKKCRILLPSNIRKLTDHPLAENYFGNAVTHIVSEKSAREIHDQSVSRMAQDWRKAVNAVDLAYVTEQMRWLRHYEKRKKLHRVLADIDLFEGDVFITNFSKFPVCDVSFNGNKPFRTEIPLIPVPGILFLLPAGENRGINLCAHLPRDLTEKLRLEKWRAELYKYGNQSNQGMFAKQR